MSAFSFSSSPSGSAFAPPGGGSASSLFSFSNPSAPKNPTPLFNSFGASSGTSTPAQSTGSAMGFSSGGRRDDDDDDHHDVDDDDAEVVYLEPPAFNKADKAQWTKSGRTMLAAVSPVNGQIAAWAAKLPGPNPNEPASLQDPKLSVADKVVYFASLNRFSDAVQTLYAESYRLFVSLQQLVVSSMRLQAQDGMGVELWDNSGQLVGMDGLLGPPSAETVVHIRRLVAMYLEEIGKVVDSFQDSEDQHDLELQELYTSVFNIFSLAQLLYLPQDGLGSSLLGEELLDWVNAVDTIHINQEGNDIMATKEPWTHELFWALVHRCLLRGFFNPAATFLKTLSAHPHARIAQLGQLLSNNLEDLPRSNDTDAYPLDHQFASAHKSWLSRFRAELTSFIGGRERGHWFNESPIDTSTGWAGYEDEFRGVIELIEGKPDRVLRESTDWREALGAWGVLVDVGLRRDDLGGVLAKVLREIPIDSTVRTDVIQVALCSGNIAKALDGCHELDTWLAAHLGDVFDKLALIPDDESFDTPLRDFFLLEYAEMLMESPSQSDLWRVIVEYLSVAGDEGMNRLRTYIVHVSVGLTLGKGKEKAVNGHESSTDGGDDDGMDVEAEPQLQALADLRDVCAELKLEDEWRTISSMIAESMIRRGEFGPAASVCLSAEDGFTLARIAEKIRDVYIQAGAQEFLRLVNSLPAAMLNDAPLTLNELQVADPNGLATGESQTTMVMFATRLAFLSEFRDYLLYLDQGSKNRAAAKLVNLLSSSVTPVGFEAVLLAESVDLLEDDDILFSSADTFELMRVLEEVLASAKFAPAEYLGQLWRHLEREAAGLEGAAKGDGGAEDPKKKKKDQMAFGTDDATKAGTALALRKLDEVRLALARNLARALVAGLDNPF